MEQPTNKSSRAISLSLAAGLVITLLTAGTVRLAEAQSNTSLGTSALAQMWPTSASITLRSDSRLCSSDHTGRNNTAIGANVAPT